MQEHLVSDGATTPDEAVKAGAYGMLPAETSGERLDRTPADNHMVCNVFAIGPDKKVQLVLVDP